jgi:folate-dependent phosphoribosylglycinamide formyltransferase PurN
MILCRPGARHTYFANALSRTGRVVAIVEEAGVHWTLRNVVNTLRPPHLTSKIRFWLRDRRRGAGEAEARFFFGESSPSLHVAGRMLRATSVNDPRVVRLADDLSPDVIAVFGTTLIRGDLLSRGRLGIINLHGGVSPRYRGTDCTFWALFNGEPDQIGCTIHFLDRGIDTGPLVAHVRPEVRAGDEELTLSWRAIRDATAAFEELLSRIESGERFGQPQRGKGRLYRLRDRAWRHERDLAKRLRRGMLRGVRLAPRVSWYTAGG